MALFPSKDVLVAYALSKQIEVLIVLSNPPKEEPQHTTCQRAVGTWEHKQTGNHAKMPTLTCKKKRLI
jgi:hypothetical protein